MSQIFGKVSTPFDIFRNISDRADLLKFTTLLGRGNNLLGESIAA